MSTFISGPPTLASDCSEPTHDGIAPSLNDHQLSCILDVIGTLWADKTKKSYGNDLLVFHIYCDFQHISKAHRCQISNTLLLSFLSSCASNYLGATLSNFTAGLRAWHVLHGHPWLIFPCKLHATLEGASRLSLLSVNGKSVHHFFTLPSFVSLLTWISMNPEMLPSLLGLLSPSMPLLIWVSSLSRPFVPLFPISHHCVQLLLINRPQWSLCSFIFSSSHQVLHFWGISPLCPTPRP